MKDIAPRKPKRPHCDRLGEARPQLSCRADVGHRARAVESARSDICADGRRADTGAISAPIRLFFCAELFGTCESGGSATEQDAGGDGPRRWSA